MHSGLYCEGKSKGLGSKTRKDGRGWNEAARVFMYCTSKDHRYLLSRHAERDACPCSLYVSVHIQVHMDTAFFFLLDLLVWPLEFKRRPVDDLALPSSGEPHLRVLHAVHQYHLSKQGLKSNP